MPGRRHPAMVLLPPCLGKQRQEVLTALSLPKKLGGRPRLAAAVVSRKPAAVGFYIRDTTSGKQMLVDTGAMMSTFPPSEEDRKHPPSNTIHLVAANGSSITCFGTKTRTISIMDRSYDWPFLIADVRTPLLGADFLAHHDLLVDVRRKRLCEMGTYRSHQLTTGPGPPGLCSVDLHEYSCLLQEFPDVFKPELRQQAGVPSKHGVYHHIATTGPPTHCKYRRLPPQKLQDAKRAFLEMERMGICRKASSPWASPLHMVKKSDGTWRPCGDYRRLNLVTTPDHYPLPNMEDLTGALHGARIFTKMDLLKSYFQVPVNPADIPKTAIITPFGTYVFAYSTFGLRNAGATFQRLMDSILGDLPFCSIYVDDILIFSKSPEEHLGHVRTVLKRLQDNGLVVRFDKCTFGAEKVDFLGHEISKEGVRPMSSKVDAISRFPAPSSVKNLQEFIGMVNYYRRFIPNIARMMTPLNDALKGKPKKLLWEPPQQAAFEETKAALCRATTLGYQDPKADLRLTTDASNIACGAVLEQVINGVPQPLAFFSKKLKPAETRYSTFDRELLAVYLAVRHFKFLLEGSSFSIMTDHQPLVHAFTKSGDAWSARQQRHLAAIAEFGCSISYVPGNRNPVADALSRVSISSIHLGIDYEDIAREQAADTSTAEAKAMAPALKWETVALSPTGPPLICDTSTGRPRPLIPPSRRKLVFDVIHGLSHPSARTTTRLITAKFVWPGVNKDSREWARTCTSCQMSKIGRHTESGVGSFPQPKRRFGHIHVDIVGPLPPSDGARFLLTIVERSTRWPEATPMTEASTSACAQALLTSWISRFGVPDDITTDRGPAFLSELWSSLASLLGTNLHSTTAYNPAANGMVERSHRSLKAALMARCSDENWIHQLPWVLLGLRTAPRANGDASPAEKVYGETLVVPGEFFPPDHTEDVSIPLLRERAGKFTPCRMTYTDRTSHYLPKEINTCKYVFVRHDAHRPPLTRPYKGPYEVLERNPKSFKLMIHGREDWISIDRLKPAYTQEEDPQVPLGRKPRVPPQNRPPEPPAVEPPVPNGRGGILPHPHPTEEPPEDGPLPLRSRRRGRLKPPARFKDYCT